MTPGASHKVFLVLNVPINNSHQVPPIPFLSPDWTLTGLHTLGQGLEHIRQCPWGKTNNWNTILKGSFNFQFRKYSHNKLWESEIFTERFQFHLPTSLWLVNVISCEDSLAGIGKLALAVCAVLLFTVQSSCLHLNWHHEWSNLPVPSH